MATLRAALLPGQPQRKRHAAAKEWAKHDPRLHAQLRGAVRSCLLRQQTWYVTERNLLVIVQKIMDDATGELKLCEIFDTLQALNTSLLAIGAERCAFRGHRDQSRVFYWGGLTAGDIPKPAIDFHDLIPLQRLVFENEEVVQELVDPDRCDAAKEGNETDFLAILFEKHARVLAGYSRRNWDAMPPYERNRVHSAQRVRQLEYARVRLGVMIAAGALDARAGEGLREPDESSEEEEEDTGVPGQSTLARDSPADSSPHSPAQQQPSTGATSMTTVKPTAEGTLDRDALPDDPFEGIDESALAVQIAVLFKDGALRDTLDRSVIFPSTCTRMAKLVHSQGLCPCSILFNPRGIASQHQADRASRPSGLWSRTRLWCA